ncbi:MAG: hypothetical protein K0R54_2713 [Clostridiaceae bacterium]|jgi:uncharacterized protein (DUF2164 family)|nr:hypothetical protein [Clostridiaceae bacterium]
MNKKNKIELPKEKKDEMILKIKNYFLNERDEEIGDLASIMIFEFIIEELSAEFYNQGVYMNDRCEDLLSIQKY